MYESASFSLSIIFYFVIQYNGNRHEFSLTDQQITSIFYDKLNNQYQLTQEKMWKEALSITALILGIYIVYLSFPSGTSPILSSDASYHIGCYDPEIKNTHSWDLGEKVRQMESKRQQNIKLNMFNSIALKSNFEEQIQEVAGGFQNYLDEYYRLKFQNQQDLHYHNSLKIAKQDFEKCIAELNLDELECNEAWSHYLKLIDQFSLFRQSLAELILRKQKQEKLIAVSLLEHSDLDQEQIQNQYNHKINQIAVKLKIIDDQIITIETEKNKFLKKIEVIDAELESLRKLRSKCPENKNLIIFCREVSKTVSKLGTKIEDTKYDRLQNRIKIKKQIMKSLESSIKKMKKFGDSQQLQAQQRMLEQHKKQLGLLNAEIENIETTEEVICRICAEQKIQELDENITKLERQKEAELQQIQTLALKKSGFYEQKAVLDKQTLDAFQEYETQISALLCYDENCKQEQHTKTREAQRTLNELKKEIIDKRIQINDLQFAVNQQMKKLTGYLKEINGANDCMRKREYYKEMLKQIPKRKVNDEQMIKAKQQIVKELADFDL